MEMHIRRGIKWNLLCCGRIFRLPAVIRRSSLKAGRGQASRGQRWRNTAIGLLVCERVICPRLDRSGVRACNEDDGSESGGWVGEGQV